MDCIPMNIKVISESNEILNLLITFVSVFSAALLAYYFTNKSNKKNLEEEIKLEKLIEFSEKVKELQNVLAGSFFESQLSLNKLLLDKNYTLDELVFPYNKIINNLGNICYEYNFYSLLLKGYISDNLNELILNEYKKYHEDYDKVFALMKNVGVLEHKSNKEVYDFFKSEKYKLHIPKLNDLSEELAINIKNKLSNK